MARLRFLLALIFLGAKSFFFFFFFRNCSKDLLSPLVASIMVKSEQIL